MGRTLLRSHHNKLFGILITYMNILKKIRLLTGLPRGVDEEVHLFIKKPHKYIHISGMKCDDMGENKAPITVISAVVEVRGNQFGWFQRCNVNQAKASAKIEHFGVSKDYLRKKVGSTFIKYVLGVLNQQMGVKDFYFKEEVGGEKALLLAALGASQIGQLNSAGFADYHIHY
jgi:hypothetical protein